MKINEYVYALESTRSAYAYIIKGEEIVLVDTGLPMTRKRILKELKSMDMDIKDIKHILLTHYDLDHIGNAAILQRLSGAKLWASKEDIPYITGSKDRPGFKKYFPYFIRVEKPDDLKAYNKELEIGDSKIEIIPTPGHTPGHVCLLFKDTLFVGDLVKNKDGKLMPYPSNWNWNTSVLKESIKNLNAYDFKWICPAHGKPIRRDDLWEKIT